MKNTDIQAELAIIDAADISELKDMFRAEFGFDIQISTAGKLAAAVFSVILYSGRETSHLKLKSPPG